MTLASLVRRLCKNPTFWLWFPPGPAVRPSCSPLRRLFRSFDITWPVVDFRVCVKAEFFDTLMLAYLESRDGAWDASRGGERDVGSEVTGSFPCILSPWLASRFYRWDQTFSVNNAGSTPIVNSGPTSSLNLAVSFCWTTSSLNLAVPFLDWRNGVNLILARVSLEGEWNQHYL